LTKLEQMLCVLKRRNFAGKNGIFNIRYHSAVVPLFRVGQGTCREWGGCGEGFPMIESVLIGRSIRI
ncbi:hypothetical protein GE21DRAFT_1221381, partial [Neurospora crassa]